MMGHCRSLLPIAAVGMLVPTGATAQNAAPALDRLLECGSITDDVGRLTCFDDQVREVRRLRTSALQVMEPKRIKPRSPQFVPVTLPIRQATWVRPGFWQIVLSDGSAWRNNEPSDVLPKQDQEIAIKKGVLGSLRATTKGISGALVRRAP